MSNEPVKLKINNQHGWANVFGVIDHPYLHDKTLWISPEKKKLLKVVCINPINKMFFLIPLKDVEITPTDPQIKSLPICEEDFS